MGRQLVLSGELTFIDLADLLQMFNANAESGVLKLTSKYSEKPGVVYIFEGNPINATLGGKSGEEALYALFGWGEGRFEFSLEEFPKEKVINKSAMAMILDALKMVDEGEIEKLGPVQFNAEKPKDKGGGISLPVIRGPAFSDYMYLADEEEFRPGDRIIEQGRHGNWLWVVLEGVVKIVKTTRQGDVTISRVGHGAFIGSLAALTRPEHARMASAVAEGKVLLGVIDTRQLISDLSGLSEDFLNLIRGTENRLNMISNRAVALKFSKNSMAGLPREIKPVIRQGDSVTKFFAVEAGTAYLVQSSGGNNTFLGALEKGDFIGHLPFFKHEHEPEMAAVFAASGLKLSIVDTDLIMAEYEKAPTLVKNILEYNSVCVSVITDMTSRNVL
ncbi:MAG: cyclic nucleotide-binding domain-containing protein [Desulfobacterales bacterium]|nr:cyclic nucleotide-binding domain-containing protein [Desulfobacterales bacterium]